MSRLTRKTNGKDYCLYCDCIEMENAIFEKKQELLSPEKYYKEEPYKMEDGYYYEDAMKRLGKIEDLMDEYNIDSIEQLENILSSKFIAGGMRNSGKSIVAKGMLYNKLSEEIGCPLNVVFKAIDKGIKTKKHYDLGSGQEFEEYIEIVEPHLTNTSVELDWLDENKYFQDYANQWCFHFKDYRYIENEENDEYECLVKLSDYQKTWWLKGEIQDE